MEWFKNYKFTKISEQLGPVKWLLPNQGKQHNVVPSECDLVIDIRVNDCYSNPWNFRSGKGTWRRWSLRMHLNASSIPEAH
jgi:acetylornithine deacetylase